MATIRLLIAGDTNVQGRAEPAQAFEKVREVLKSADLRLAHLEGLFGPTSQPARPDLPFKPRWRHSEPEIMRAYAAAGFDALCCASNVAHGPAHILKTIELLDEAGIAHAGIGRCLAQAQQPAIVHRTGVKVGLLSHTSVFWPYDHAATEDQPGCAVIRAHTAYEPGRRALEMPGAPPLVRTWPDPADLAGFTRRVSELRAQVDVAIVSCHWGVSGSTEVAEYQRTLAHAAIDAGADLVVGHHPHVLQPVETYRGRVIFYSLGNFAFDWWVMRHKSHAGLVARVEAEPGGIRRVSFLPAWRDPQDNLVRLCHPVEHEAGRGITEQAQALSAGSAELLIEGTEVVVRV